MTERAAPRFSVIIVNYNGGRFLAGALNSLRRQTFRDFEVFVVDNASTDGSADDLNGEHFSHFELIKSSDNLGFAGGNNLAAQRARGDWLALLNPDAEADPDWLERVAAGADRHPGIAMFACAQYRLGDRSTLDGAGDSYFGFGLPWRGGYDQPADALPGEGECFSPCGASAIYNREVFLAHGGFDETFFCFCEDVDLGYRMRLAGERCVFLPDAAIEHEGGGVSGEQSPFAVYHGARNRIWTFAKNTPWPLLVATLPGQIAINIYLIVRAIGAPRFAPLLRGVKDGVAGSARTVRRRNTRRHVSSGQIARSMSWSFNKLRRRQPDVRSLP